MRTKEKNVYIHESNGYLARLEAARQRELRKAQWWLAFNSKREQNALIKPSQHIEIIGREACSTECIHIDMPTY